MATIAYLRVSTDQQDLESQRYHVLKYAHEHKITIDEFIEVEMSSRKDASKRRIMEMLTRLDKGDCLMVSELSRLGRSTAEVINTVNELIGRGARFISVKQNLDVVGKNDITSKVMITMFSLFAELERDLISERTKQALAAKKQSGVKLGRPKGSLGKSKLDDKKDQIAELLKYSVSKSAIARICGTSRGTLYSFLNTRDVRPPMSNNSKDGERKEI